MSFSSRGTRREQLKHLRHCSIITCNAGTIFCINYYVWSVTFSVHAHCPRARSLHLVPAMFKVNSFPVPNKKGKKKGYSFYSDDDSQSHVWAAALPTSDEGCSTWPIRLLFLQQTASSPESSGERASEPSSFGRFSPASEEWGEEGERRCRRAATRRWPASPEAAGTSAPRSSRCCWRKGMPWRRRLGTPVWLTDPSFSDLCFSCFS